MSNLEYLCCFLLRSLHRHVCITVGSSAKLPFMSVLRRRSRQWCTPGSVHCKAYMSHRSSSRTGGGGGGGSAVVVAHPQLAYALP